MFLNATRCGGHGSQGKFGLLRVFLNVLPFDKKYLYGKLRILGQSVYRYKDIIFDFLII